MIFYFLLAGTALFMALKGKTTVESASEIIEEHLDSWTEFDSLFKKYGQINSVPWQYLKAICLNESNLGKAKSVAAGIITPYDIENSKSSDGKSWGIMQVTVTTGKDLDPACTAEKLNNPEYSVKLAAKYVGQLQLKFNRADSRWLEWVVKSYNQGPGNTNKEKSGKSTGFAQEYWERFKRNLERVNNS